MTDNSRERIEALIIQLRIVANMINMGEKIRWAQETTLMDQAADLLETHHQELQKARKEERERVNKILAGHGKGCDPRYHAECIEMIYEDVNQSELDQPITSDRRDEEAHAERCEGKY